MKQFFNIAESWPVYDTIIISEELYGNEENLGGFYTGFAAFAARSDHSLFKIRSEALAGLAYNNQAAQDRMDFAFHAMSIGISFFGPSFNPQWLNDDPVTYPANDNLITTFWQHDLPRYVGVEFRIGPDVKLKGTCFRLPPGYGPFGSGVSQGPDLMHADVPIDPIPAFSNHMVIVGTQGVPDVSNRFTFRPPNDIPRNEQVEVRLYLSDIARSILNTIPGPGHNFIVQDYDEPEGTPTWTVANAPCRFGIQASLWGVREVQQRGEYHA